MEKIALIAGWGKLPAVWAERAVEAGLDITVFTLAEEETVSFADLSLETVNINIGRVDELIGLIHNNNIKKILMIGKVRKSHLFSGISLDDRMKLVLSQLEDYNDDTIMRAVVEEFIKEGLDVLPQSYLLEDMLPEAGLITSSRPDLRVSADMEYGLNMAHNLGSLDIGQTVLVKDKAVMAVEAIEGTDEAIKRAAKFGGRGIVMAKASKPQQDIRFDIPTVGLKTLDLLLDIGADGLIIEAGKTFLLDKEEFCRKAEKGGLNVVAASFTEEGELIIPWVE